jgi:hypothetical protein
MAGIGASHGVDETPVSGRSVTLDPASVLRALLVVIAALVLLSVGAEAVVLYADDFPLRDTAARLFFVNAEQSIPTLYSTLMLLASALLLAAVARTGARRGPARPWLVLSLLFCVLAIDEFASLHEDSSSRVQSLLGVEGGVFLFAWVIPGALVVAVVAIAFVPFLRSLPPSTRRGFLLAGILFVGGAIGVEMVGSAYLDAHGGVEDMAYAFLTALEEGLEMTGVAVFVWTLLRYVADALPGLAWTVRVEPRAASEHGVDAAAVNLRDAE